MIKRDKLGRLVKGARGKESLGWRYGKRKKKCLYCGKLFEVWHYRIHGKFCSHKCYSKSIKGIKKESLSKETRRKIGESRKGSKHWNWQGGLMKVKGRSRIKVWKPNHPQADSKGYIFRSRLMMEKKIGRILTFEETVHHINGIKTDDRIENLWLFKNNRTHVKYEANLTKTYRKWIQQGYNLN